MALIRTRTILIDIPENADPFITMNLEKVIFNADGEQIQVIGGFDRIVKRLNDVSGLPVGAIADDGLVSALELFTLIATHTHIWVMEKYGGEAVLGGVKVD